MKKLSFALLGIVMACSMPDVSIQEHYKHYPDGKDKHISISDNVIMHYYNIIDYGNDRCFDEVFVKEDDNRRSYINQESLDLKVMKSKFDDHKNPSIISKDSMNALVKDIFDKYSVNYRIR